MPQEGNIKVKRFYYYAPTGPWGRPINFGAPGKIISLLGVNFVIGNFRMTAHGNYHYVALSSNPRHDLNPPADIVEFCDDQALYATFHHVIERSGTADYIGWGKNLWQPLYGLQRPTRQVVVGINGQVLACQIVLEYYYQEIELTQAEQSDENLVYGKYRRNK